MTAIIDTPANLAQLRADFTAETGLLTYAIRPVLAWPGDLFEALMPTTDAQVDAVLRWMRSRSEGTTHSYDYKTRTTRMTIRDNNAI